MEIKEKIWKRLKMKIELTLKSWENAKQMEENVKLCSKERQLKKQQVEILECVWWGDEWYK